MVPPTYCQLHTASHVQGYGTPEMLLMKGVLAKFSKEELFFSAILVMISPIIDFTSTHRTDFRVY